MFKNNDKIFMSLVNAKKINGDFVPFSLVLPISEIINIPNEIVSLDVFEYCEGSLSNGGVAFHIYVGSISTINELMPDLKSNKLRIRDKLNISSIDLPVCYKEINGIKEVFAVINDGDIVVNDYLHLEILIRKLSSCFRKVLENVDDIKTLSYKKNNK